MSNSDRDDIKRFYQKYPHCFLSICMINLKIDIPDSFFNGEVRSGYRISSTMKKVWAVELDLLSEAMRVMDKHSIKYFAIGGTLLGSVRHKGFIPWDDDIDIAIPRNDYERFRKIARDEFSHPYFFQDEFNSPGLLCGHAKLRNSETTMIHSNHLDEKVGSLSFNMGIFIDFFPVDSLPDGIEEYKKWQNRLKSIARSAWHLRLFSHRGRMVGNNKTKFVLRKLFLSVIRDPNHYFYKYNRLLMRYSNVSTEKSCLYCLYCRNEAERDRWSWRSSDLDSQSLIPMPFEFMSIPCPANYDAVLTRCYGNWHEEKQVNSIHGSTSESFYDVDNSYLVYFDKNGFLDRSLVRLAMKRKD